MRGRWRAVVNCGRVRCDVSAPCFIVLWWFWGWPFGQRVVVTASKDYIEHKQARRIQFRRVNDKTKHDPFIIANLRNTKLLSLDDAGENENKKAIFKYAMKFCSFRNEIETKHSISIFSLCQPPVRQIQVFIAHFSTEAIGKWCCHSITFLKFRVRKRKH